MERYQGIVELRPTGLSDSVRHYFEQSEQLDSGITVAVDRVRGQWRGGGLLVQRLASDPDTPPKVEAERRENWRRAMALMVTATEGELTSAALSIETLLLRLFHEDGVRVYDPLLTRRGCRCSRERIESVLKSLPADEVLSMRKPDGSIDVTCEFCSRRYDFSGTALAALLEATGAERAGDASDAPDDA